ncbi:MAG: CRISPR system precrRNA processing endoribonuclease RAMP protein Cas6 [Archaeoglobaceae archaeon]
MLKLTSLILRLRFQRPTSLPYWMGSAFRGGFGIHLRKIVCYRPMHECEDCKFRENCLFYAAYENPYAKKGKSPPPRPIIFIPPFFGEPMDFKEGAEIEVKLLLLGEYSRYLPHVLLSLRQFGSYGLGDRRHIGLNKFEVAEAKCAFSGETVYEEGAIYPSRLKEIDVKKLQPFEGRRVRVNFYTPIQLPLGFPPPPQHLLKLIHQRLVRFVNEYGSGEKVGDFTCEGKVKPVMQRYHRLVGVSQRTGKREFWHCWTGIADYEFEKLDETGRWLLGVGKVLGAGAKSSFGMGFLDLFAKE